MKKEYIVVDIDGTIANNQHRAHLLSGLVASDENRGTKVLAADRWDEFYDLCDKDEPYLDMRSIIKRVAATSQVIYLTGRVERIRGKTVSWLKKHGFPSGTLYMRANDDFRRNSEFKLEALKTKGLTPENVLCIFEDNDVEAFREAGFRTLHVMEGGLR